MSESKWVQHISGQGEKWEVSEDSEKYERMGQWKVMESSARNFNFHYLPKSEYRLCDPPEVYENVSSECEAEHVSDGVIMRHCGKRFLWDRYRIRKVEIEREYPNAKQWAFIVERRKA